MSKKSNFEYLSNRESQAVKLRYGKRSEWTYEGERTRQTASVAIDGNCLRQGQSVCWYVKADL